MSSGRTCCQSSRGGVDWPTFAASSQCALGMLRCVRFHLVRPPVLVSMGSPLHLRRSYSAHRMLLTAAASLSGSPAWACRCGNAESPARCGCLSSGCSAGKPVSGCSRADFRRAPWARGAQPARVRPFACSTRSGGPT